MKRMDRYLLSEMVLPFIIGVLAIVVMLVGNTLFALLETIIKYGIPFMVVAKLVAFNIPTLLVLAFPACTALSTAWAVTRLARDSEITVLRMSGISLRRFFLPIFAVGLIASLAAFWIGDRVVPTAQHEFQKTQGQMLAYALQSSPEVAANKVISYQNYSFHIRQVQKDPSGDPNKLLLSGVTIFESPLDNGFPILTTAQSATYDHDIWTLHQVVVQTIGADGFVKLTITGKTTILNLRVPLDLAESGSLQPDEQSMAQLHDQMDALAKTGQDTKTVAVTYYSKLSLPFICLAFALCAAPLALRFARAGAYIGIFVSLVMVWVAWNTLLLTKALGLYGRIDPMLAAWSPDLIFAFLGIYLLWRME